MRTTDARRTASCLKDRYGMAKGAPSWPPESRGLDLQKKKLQQLLLKRKESMNDYVEFEHTPQGFSIKTGHPLLADIHADFRTVPPEQRQGTARALLVASALDCFCGTLNAALLSRDVQYRRIIGRGRAEKVQNDGVSRVTKIELDIRVEVDDADAGVLEHCLRIVKGCMITRSLMDGIEVGVHAARA